ncbi:signal transduction histidine kinase regulating citrate/malate metabolism [Halorhabdus utahensis DSM 12940]|uniref:histidine kinase n=1 Tax=Halorhabdus utahensis (strain DSM 12940 / JCM 11049 / AX-2) TaxID=519442 RepID=C7NRN8_HALUD|nr:histidine kinase N-terminal 7TM domain-containing protein [Halorhabdus utahensis]ACV11974.1 signal transduction histidine kinase regulating citrate/malate metabolism [Halorhabdus utahensis DSM 12940]
MTGAALGDVLYGFTGAVLGVSDIYPGVVALAGLITAGLTVVGVQYRDVPGGEWFAATMGLSNVWIAGALVTVLSSNRTALVLAEIVMTGCSLVVPVAWTAFVITYVGLDWMSQSWRLAALFVPPLVGIAAIAATPLTKLYFADVAVVHRPDGISVVSTPPGILAWLVLAYVFVLLVVGLVLIARLILLRGLFSRQASWLLIGTMPPFVTVMLEPAGVVGEEHLPLAPIGFALMGLAYGYGLFYHRLFDLSPGTWRLGTGVAFEGLSEGLVIVDTHGDVLGCNRSACERFGWERSTVFGRNIAEFDAQLSGAIGRSEPTEFRMDGQWYEVNSSPITDARDREVGHVLVIRDVTERHERRQQLEVLNRALRHNLRNDMMVVSSRAQALEDRYDDPMARTIVDTATDIVEMADKARAVEESLRETEGETQDVDVGPFLGRLIENVCGGDQDAPVAIDVEPGLSVRTDESLLMIVVANLVENAIEHGIRDGMDADRAPVRISADRVLDGVAIEVADDGPGIPQSELDVIERGTETPTSHGRGIGLWLVTWGATRLNADVTFDTDDGTTARLVVPDR